MGPTLSRARPTRLPVLAGAVAIAVMAAIAYAPSFRGVFVYDDTVAIVENPNIRALWPLTEAMSAPPESPVSARPVAALTLAINHALAPADVRDVLSPGRPGDSMQRAQFLRNVWGYHAMNLLLHVLTALAIAGVVRRTLLSDALRNRFGSAATLLGFSSAGLWVIHPLTTDAVTYVAQRTEVLMGLCFALTLYCSIRASRSGGRGWIAGAVVACAAGMGSKQTMVTAPIVVWIWDWLFLPAADEDRPGRARLYIGLGATWMLLGALVAYERWPTSIGFALEDWTPWTYLLTQTTVIAHYIRLSILGGPLALDYDGWPMSRSVADVWPYALLLLALFALTIGGVIRKRAWSFPAMVWFAALAPSSSVLPLATEIAAERRMYIPLAAFLALVVCGMYAIGSRLLAKNLPSPRRAGLVRATAIGALIAAGVALGSMTYARNQDFESAERIWQDTVEKRPRNSRARLNYGVSLADLGRTADAEGQLREAVRLKETNAPAHLNLGALLAARGRADEGIKHLERALALDPTYTAAYRNLGEAYGALGNRALAARNFSLAVERNGDDVFLLNRLGWLLATSPEDSIRDGTRAVTTAERAVTLTERQDTTSLDTLAAAYAESDRFTDAARVAAEAVSLAERQGRAELLPELRDRLARYQAGQKFRER
jgi:protein O-mannosyl-transferase